MNSVENTSRLKSLASEFFQLGEPARQTYFPNSPRKSKWRIWIENIAWALKYKELNRYYYIYGMDRKDIDTTKHVLPYRTFTRIRDSKNLRVTGSNFNYASLLRDKFVFGQFLSSLSFPTPRNIALIQKDIITWLDNMNTEPIESLCNSSIRVRGFCKKLTGLQGKGAFPLEIDDGRITINEEQASVGEFIKAINGTYLLQERVEQHHELNHLYPHALNTMRIVTFNNNGNVEVFNAAMRIGTRNKHVDNWGIGGIAVGIDLNTGQLRKTGYYKPSYGRLVEVHPDTNITLHKFQVPFFKESLELVSRIHRYLYGIHSIGWDVAVGPEGPIVIEANEDWDGSFAMAAEENFKTRFLGMFRGDN